MTSLIILSMSKGKFLFSGTEVITDDLRVAFVETYHSPQRVDVRYHNKLWPFPEWDMKLRSQLTPVVFDEPEALL